MIGRRVELVGEIEAAARQHRPRSDKVRELRDLTTKQIRWECRWGWLRKYKPSERTITIAGVAAGSVIFVAALALHVWLGGGK